jgi:hypothetical protein
MQVLATRSRVGAAAALAPLGGEVLLTSGTGWWTLGRR